MVSPHDIYTSKLNTAYEVLQGLESAVTTQLQGELLKPDYNEIADLEEIAAQEFAERDSDDEDEEDDHKDNEDKEEWNGCYIDVNNFSLSFKCALADLDGSDTDVVLVHIGMYRVEETDCNLVKFTRLSGTRDAFIK